MKVYRGIDSFKKLDCAVVTTGTFDGVHLGHQKIIDSLNKEAKKIGGESVLLTFFPHPRMVLFPDAEIKLLNSLNEKIELLQGFGVQHLIIIPFTKEFSQLSSIDFVRDILVNSIGTKKLVIGYDHHFGKNREGSFEHLKKFGPQYGFQMKEIPAHDIKNVNVSSTKIRTALEEGDVKTANHFLGHQFCVSGIVTEGNQLGRTIGYPTANITIDETHKILPKDGAYAVLITIEKHIYQGMLNIGIRPTVDGSQRVCEVNIFDFNKDIYGQKIKVELLHRLRDEVKFETLNELQLQLEKDRKSTLSLLN